MKITLGSIGEKSIEHRLHVTLSLRIEESKNCRILERQGRATFISSILITLKVNKGSEKEAKMKERKRKVQKKKKKGKKEREKNQTEKERGKR